VKAVTDSLGSYNHWGLNLSHTTKVSVALSNGTPIFSVIAIVVALTFCGLDRKKESTTRE
jgi:hypothetical protein